ncbi:putative bifunctional diguanylate cyclase/phosphodiesterase [Castellaniella caeni]|uniref:putative bifunctional diguanylate cyclase/phosphodiesterase n=1 Tax=Castellaniella caeni TaxID=266123 RepID=UPI000AB1E865|nr:bifunctional diguanylate cyclase/phosphodiesterase [Castellaniella caeni]
MPPTQDSAALPATPAPLRTGGPFLLYFLAPILMLVAVLASAHWFPSVGELSGQTLPAQFQAGSFNGPAHALAALRGQPLRLSAPFDTGPAWLLTELDSPADDQTLLLRGNELLAPQCWLLQPGQPQRLRTLVFRRGVLGHKAQVPNFATGQVLCELDAAMAGTVSIALWPTATLTAAEVHTARQMGLLEGGLLTLALFVAIIALTTRDQLYVLLAAWLVCNVRLSAWLLKLDHLWLGHLLSPDALLWSRKLTLLMSFTCTWLLFAHLYRASLGRQVFRRIRQAGALGSVLLALPLLAPAYEGFQTACFLAAWLGTALVATTLIHALFRYATRPLFWHTIAVSLVVVLVVITLIAVALDQRHLMADELSVYLWLSASLIIALATANRIREDRQQRLRHRNELIAHDSLSPLGLFTLGATRHFEHLNPNARDMLQVAPQAEALALSWHDFFPDIDWVSVSLATEQGRDTEIQQHPRTDAKVGVRNFLLRATLVGSRIEGSLQDISARSETIRNLRLMTDHDALTNTLNRRGIEEAMQVSIDALQQSGTPCALAYLSLDHLKRVNDLFGHSSGDLLLQLACDRLKYALTEQQQLGRIGSDEFIVLFPNVRAREARRIGQDIVETLNSAPFVIGNRAFQIKSAMGLIDLDARMGPKDAIAAASRACKEARKQHQDIILYEENTHELFDHANELRVFEQLEQGTPPEDVYLEMQPIMSLRHPLQTLNFEVLLRVRGTDGRPAQTQKIIQAAEESGMITMIDKWVFATTLEWMSKHHLKLSNTQQININLSGVSLNDDRFIDTLFGLLSQQPQFARRLCVEITEGVALQDLERTRQLMRRLQRMGARVALDDFGAGYTSFSYLKELPADTIKIDGTLIRDMLTSEANIAIVNSIVDLAHNLGMECIAEWVEDAATLRTLAEMGVDYVQGYVISAARAPSDMLAYDNILPLIANPAAQAYVEELSGRTFNTAG